MFIKLSKISPRYLKVPRSLKNLFNVFSVILNENLIKLRENFRNFHEKFSEILGKLRVKFAKKVRKNYRLSSKNLQNFERMFI